MRHSPRDGPNLVNYNIAIGACARARCVAVRTSPIRDTVVFAGIFWTTASIRTGSVVTAVTVGKKYHSYAFMGTKVLPPSCCLRQFSPDGCHGRTPLVLVFALFQCRLSTYIYLPLMPATIACRVPVAQIVFLLRIFHFQKPEGVRTW